MRAKLTGILTATFIAARNKIITDRLGICSKGFALYN
jgi:hypothetical protein